MTKIYEALKEADKEKTDLGELSDPHLPVKVPQRMLDSKKEETLIGLYQNIVTMLPHAKSRIIQFMGAGETDGTADLIWEFAWISAMKLHKSVALLDTNSKKGGQSEILNFRPKEKAEGTMADDVSRNETIHHILQAPFSIPWDPLAPGATSHIFESSQIDAFLEKLRQEFDLILINSPSAITDTNSLGLSGKVDGVILVVEAEKTRWQVVQKVKRKTLSRGANILGVVLNKRRYPIPDFVYNRL